jgi:hypothetical protein
MLTAPCLSVHITIKEFFVEGGGACGDSLVLSPHSRSPDLLDVINGLQEDGQPKK